VPRAASGEQQRHSHAPRTTHCLVSLTCRGSAPVETLPR
jgi:hypothetical protein